jgi:hypothetical protein
MILRRKILALSCLSLFSIVPPVISKAATPQSRVAQAPAWENEADPAFVLKLSFAVAHPQGVSSLVLAGTTNTAYQLDIGARSMALLRRQNVKAIRLAECKATFGVTNTLILTRRKSVLRVALNGQVLLDVKDAGVTPTKLSLVDSAHRLKLLQEPRYQPTEDIYLTDDFMVLPKQESHWKTVAGNWSVAGVSQPSGAADPFKMIGFTPGTPAAGGVTINSDSRWFWNDYQVDVATRLLNDDTAVGLVFGYQSPHDFYCVSWGGSAAVGANRLRLWHRLGDRTVVLAERAAPPRSRQWYRLSAHTLGTQISIFLDENRLLSATDAHFIGGQCGLYESGVSGAEFDDFAVRGVETPALLPARETNSDDSWRERRFATDPFMASWGAAGSDWEPATTLNERWFWNRGQFFNSVDMRIALGGAPAEPGASQPTPQPAVKVPEIALFAKEDGTGGYRMRLEDKRLSLVKDGQVLASGAFDPQADLHILADAGQFEITSGGHRVLQYADHKPLTTGRVGLRVDGAPTAAAVAGEVALTSPSAREYRFDVAPTDWEIEAGDWQTTTRWACVPDWNFFGGRGEPIATIWNKRRFAGDQWIDAFLAPREGTTDRMHFTYPVNLNLTFCAAGEQLGSGYSLVFRSHDLSTVLYRAGQPVAESKNLVLPDWRDDDMTVYYHIAQTWQHFQILKQGGHIRVWIEVQSAGRPMVERQLLIDYTDTKPLQGDRMALWTWGRNGMSVARLDIAASRIGPPVVSLPEVRVTRLPTVPQHGARLVLTKAGQKSGAAASTFEHHVNPINGGWFRTDLFAKPLEAMSRPDVSFDFRAQPNVALGLYAVVNGQKFRADFLGTITDDADAVPFGRVRVTKLEGGWQRASFPLLHALRQFFPTGDVPPVEQLFLADLSSLPEHIGGLQVNPRGAIFDMRAVAPTTRSDNASAPLFALQSGTQSVLPDSLLRLALKNESADPAAYDIAINDHRLKLGEPGLAWNGEAGEYEIDPAAAGLAFNDNQAVHLSVLPAHVATMSVAPAQPVFAHEWTVAYAADKTPPAAPVVALGAEPDRVDTFETGLGSWKRIGGEQGAALWREANTGAATGDDGPTGKYYLRLYHRELSGTYGVQVRGEPFDARRWPVITFDYRLHPRVKLSLVCEVGGKSYEFRFAGHTRTFPIIGSVRNVHLDNEWHQAEVNLLDALHYYNVPGTIVTRLYFANTGIMNNLQDISWSVDNFRFVPALPETATPVGDGVLKWSAHDDSGIAGYSWVMDNASDTIPPATVKDNNTSAPAVAGTTYLHIRARDRAGNWGPTTHFRYTWLPTGSAAKVTTVAYTGPDGADAGKTLAAPAVALRLQGIENIDVESLHWRARARYASGATTAWKDYTPATGGVELDAKQGVLRWHDASLTPQGAASPYTLECAVQAADLTGQAALQEQHTWTVQPAQDAKAPAAPYLSYIPTNRLARYDFEDGMPKAVELRRSAWVLHDTHNAATGTASARVVNVTGYDFFSAFLRKTPFAVQDYPLVGFDYRFDPADPGRYNLNLSSVVNGDLQIVKLTDSVDGYSGFSTNVIGKVPDVRTDGQWHHGVFDFGAMLRRRYPQTPRFYAESLATWATGPGGYQNPQGANMWLDNITFYSTLATGAAFEWQPPADDNGIRGYSYKLDHRPDTMPAQRVMTTDSHAELKNLNSGKWYFHVRACDNAGNWGPAAHIDFELTKPSGK